MKNASFRTPAEPLLNLSAQVAARLRAAVIAGTLLIAVLLGLRPYGKLASLLGPLAILPLALVLLINFLPWGVVALAPVAFLVDMPVRTGTNVNLNATFLLVLTLSGVWLARMLVIEKKIRLLPSPVNLPALLFMATCLLGWLTSAIPWLPMRTGSPSLPAQLGALLLYLLSIAALLLAGNLLQDLRLIKFFTWSYLGLGFIYFLAALAPGGYYAVVRKWFVDAQYAGAVYWTLLVALTLGQALFNRRLRIGLRLGLAGGALGVLGFALFRRSEWLSGWLPALIAVWILLWLWNWRVALAVTVVGSVTLLPTLVGFYNNQVNTESQQWSSYTRYVTWPIVYELFKLNPLTGLGPGNYVYYTPYYNLLGYYVRFNTHNNYFDILLQAGLLGLAAFLWLAYRLLRLGWELRQRTREPFAQAYTNAMLAATLAILVSGGFADWFMPFIYNIGINGFQASVWLWFFLGGMVSLWRLHAPGESQGA